MSACSPAGRGPHAVLFVTAYLCVSLVLAVIQNLQWIGEVRLPLLFDLAALAAFLLLMIFLPTGMLANHLVSKALAFDGASTNEVLAGQGS